MFSNIGLDEIVYAQHIHITQLDNLSPIVSVWEQFIYIFVKITIHKT